MGYQCCDLFNAKAMFFEEQRYWYYSIHDWSGDKSLYYSPKGTSLKVNVLVRLKFELAYYDSTIQYISH